MGVVPVAMRSPTDIVQKRQINVRSSHPLLAVVKAAQDADMGTVEHPDKVQPVEPAGIKRVLRRNCGGAARPGRHLQPPKPGADNRLIGRVCRLAQKVAQDMQRPTEAVDWCHVKVSDTAVPCSLQSGVSVPNRGIAVKPANSGIAEAKCRDLQPPPRETLRRFDTCIRFAS